VNRCYDRVLRNHFARNRQLLFLHGPRQVGKTTTARADSDALGDSLYLNYDNLDYRRPLLAGPRALVKGMELDRFRDATPICILDEIHELSDWKTLLRGLYDSYGARLRVPGPDGPTPQLLGAR